MPFLLSTEDTTSSNLADLPKIEVNVSIQEVGALRAANDLFFGRSITVEITLSNIKSTLANNAIARAFTEAQVTALNNINAITPSSLSLEALQKPVDNGESKLSIYIDKTGQEPLANIYMFVSKIRQEYLIQTLNSFKNYIFAAINNDLNP
ncbi:hypothetical protein LC593_35675 [Nostoc sp. CHAB 5844]|nr:hypothetical protein [Nostoc sp. CHAB 5844]